jgi:hypothetical protein
MALAIEPSGADGALPRRLAADFERFDGGHRAGVQAGGAREGVELTRTTTARLRWQLAADDVREPWGRGRLDTSRLVFGGQAEAAPFGAQGTLVRAAAELDRSQRREEPASTSIGTTVRSRSLRLAVGGSGRGDRLAWSASYGAEAGRSASGAGARWARQIVDLAADAQWRLEGGSRITLETRLNAGQLDTDGAVLPGVRFVGGGREQPFLLDGDWQLRAAPLLRSVGANALGGRASGAAAGPSGADRFAALNLTAAYQVWRQPLVPAELTRNPELTETIEGQLKSATSLLEAEYTARDPGALRAAGRLAALSVALRAFDDAVAAARTARAGQPEASFKRCERASNTAARRLREAQEASGGTQLGSLAPLVSDEDHALGKVQAACVDGLNAEFADAAIAAAGAALEAQRLQVVAELDAIDVASARRAAESEMAPVRRTLRTLLYETNLLAVSPLLMLDVAHLSPQPGDAGRRSGLGLGVRITLVDSVDVSVGYMANRRRQPGEDRGAFFLTMTLRELTF